MDEININGLLKKIGMKFFVDYYTNLSNKNNTVNDITELVLKKHKDYSIKAIRTRISKSRKIIKEGMGKTALLQIKSAENIGIETKDKINELL